jgi:hypothetical protein
MSLLEIEAILEAKPQLAEKISPAHQRLLMLIRENQFCAGPPRAENGA